MLSANRMIRFAYLCIILFAPAACAPRDALVGQEITGNFDGKIRSWTLFDATPKALGQRPLVVLLHGHGGTGAGMQRLTGMNKLAEKHGFVALYPDGLNKRWRDGRAAMDDGVDDVAFLTTLIQQVIALGRVDPRRVYLTGMSNGAFMAHRLLCEPSHTLFAAAAAVSGGISVETSQHCDVEDPPALAVLNGTDDPLVPFNGGPVARKSGKNGEMISTDLALDLRRRIAGCWHKASSHEVIAEPSADFYSEITTWSDNCPNREVVLVRTNGGGHAWPGGWGYLPEVVIGKTTRTFDASAWMWAFFSRHARP